MPCCAVPGCPTGSGHYRGEHYALHPFPKNDSVKKQWIENINRPNCVPSEHKRFYVCSKHFSPDCYLTGEENVDNRGRKRKKVKFLKPDAVPTLHFTIFTVTKSGLCCTKKVRKADLESKIKVENVDDQRRKRKKVNDPRPKLNFSKVVQEGQDVSQLKPVTKIKVYMSSEDSLRFKPILVNSTIAFQCLKCSSKFKSLFFGQKHYEKVHLGLHKEIKLEHGSAQNETLTPKEEVLEEDKVHLLTKSSQKKTLTPKVEVLEDKEEVLDISSMLNVKIETPSTSTQSSPIHVENSSKTKIKPKVFMSEEDHLKFVPFWTKYKVAYQCRNCTSKYNSLHKAQKHYEKVHANQYKCHHCQLKLSNEIAFKLHMKNHNDLAKNKLSIQDFDDFSFKRLDNGMYQCPQCSSYFKSNVNEQEHFEKHHPENFKEYVPNPPNIHTGIRFTQLENGMFQCPNCLRFYTNNRGQFQHHCAGRPSDHQRKQSAALEKVTVANRSKLSSKLKELKEIIQNSSVKCAFCEDSFQTISDLNVHVESEHNINNVEPNEDDVPAIFLDSQEIKTEVEEDPLHDPLDGQEIREIKTEVEIKEEPSW